VTPVRLAFALVLLGAGTAHAHARSVSYSSWTVDGSEAVVRVRISELDMSALAARGELDIERYVQGHLRLFSGDRPCVATRGSFIRLHTEVGWQRFEWRTACPSEPTRVRSDVLAEELPAHLHFVRLRRAGSEEDHALTETRREASLGAAGTQPAATTVAGYVGLGVRHIWSGLDHLVFLLALMLVARTLKELAGVITGFTVGHSITLCLAVLGQAATETRAIEALVGLSIVLVAVENVWLAENRKRPVLPLAAVVLTTAVALAGVALGSLPAAVPLGLALFTGCYFALASGSASPTRLRWAVASLFGLVHGFAFAGALAGSGLPVSRTAPALLGFNLGVEAGQLVLVAVAWPAILVARRKRIDAELLRWGSAAAVCAGMFWLLTRTLG